MVMLPSSKQFPKAPPIRWQEARLRFESEQMRRNDASSKVDPPDTAAPAELVQHKALPDKAAPAELVQHKALPHKAAPAPPHKAAPSKLMSFLYKAAPAELTLRPTEFGRPLVVKAVPKHKMPLKSQKQVFDV
jgi:hypothetical protein